VNVTPKLPISVATTSMPTPRPASSVAWERVEKPGRKRKDRSNSSLQGAPASSQPNATALFRMPRNRCRGRRRQPGCTDPFRLGRPPPARGPLQVFRGKSAPWAARSRGATAFLTRWSNAALSGSAQSFAMRKSSPATSRRTCLPSSFAASPHGTAQAAKHFFDGHGAQLLHLCLQRSRHRREKLRTAFQCFDNGQQFWVEFSARGLGSQRFQLREFAFFLRGSGCCWGSLRAEQPSRRADPEAQAPPRDQAKLVRRAAMPQWRCRDR
jgi:hypothetical protein